ncbi:aminoglycoside phosphotransferase family protein [Solimonas variicoloris]|uniref:aminoglycoside phosphotransferase family protein n=1 Tax=Solimonas variicoloris TaxID=254408 RepID=UPI00036A1A37|nr:phosphotransferase [Solimonas variicoloris]
MSHSAPVLELDARAAAGRDWALRQLGLADARFAPASADASFRRYFRLESGADSWVLMDAPPAREDCAPFIQVAQLLHEAGLHAPRIVARDLASGYLLLTDLGRQTYLQRIRDGGAQVDADALMEDAIDALIRWQLASRPGVLPPYDAVLLQRELQLFPDWYVARHLQTATRIEQAAALEGIERLLVESALAQPRVYVHRDYMPRNLMVSAPNPGILDFQDAVEGPLAYDVVSLFKDAFLSWPAERVERWRRLYAERARRAGLPVADDAEFERQFDWMGVQRHLKVIGIFARIQYRDGKPQYLADVPRFIAYVREVAVRYRELTPLLRLFDELGLHDGGAAA